jgi:hypothetical protein
MTDSLPVTNADVYQAKAVRRKTLAKDSLESKLQVMMRMQRMNLEMKKASGRLSLASRPWNMSEEEYQKHISG